MFCEILKGGDERTCVKISGVTRHPLVNFPRDEKFEKKRGKHDFKIIKKNFRGFAINDPLGLPVAITIFNGKLF